MKAITPNQILPLLTRNDPKDTPWVQEGCVEYSLPPNERWVYNGSDINIISVEPYPNGLNMAFECVDEEEVYLFSMDFEIDLELLHRYQIKEIPFIW